MPSLLGYLAAAAAIVAAGFRCYGTRRMPPDTSSRYLVVGLLTLGVSLALIAPPTLAVAAPFEPFPHFTRFVANALAMCTACSVLAMLAHAVSDPGRARARVRRQLGVLAAIVLARAALLLIAGPERSEEFTSAHADSPLITVYVALFLGYMAFAIGQFVRLLRHYIRRPDTSALMRVGLRVSVLGCAVGGVWIVWKVSVVIALYLDVHLVDRPAAVSFVLASVCVALVAGGTSYAVWARALHRAARRARARRAVVRLTPLWSQVTEFVPEVRLNNSSDNRAARADDGDEPEPPKKKKAHVQKGDGQSDAEALYRRLIEVRDAQLLLADYVPDQLDQDIAEHIRARGLDPRTAGIVIEAGRLAAGMRNYRSDERGLRANPTPTLFQHEDPLVEAEWLIDVYHALRTDPTVAAVTGGMGITGHASAETLDAQPNTPP